MKYQEYFPFWEKLAAGQQEMLSEKIRERSFMKGDILHRGSAGCTGLLLVLSGHLRAYTLSEEGKELTLYRLFERDICLFSASCIFSEIQFEVMVTAEQDTVVLQIPADVYKRLMEESAPVANYTNQLMAARFSDVMWLMDQILNKKLDTRLAALLLEEKDLTEGEKLSVTHEQLASHLGSVREVVTRMLRYFQSEGLVKLGRGSIQLLDVERLHCLAEGSIR